MNKVSEIEFHITEKELEDFILRAAELIKDGYRLYSFQSDGITYSYNVCPEPYLHIKFTRWQA